VGRAINGRRERVIVATKVGLEWDARGEVRRNASAARIRKEIEDSPRRLRADYVDTVTLMQLSHFRIPAVPWRSRPILANPLELIVS
jgi:aryl-alcohol dehydrogenase-like predicted oxidoreductase